MAADCADPPAAAPTLTVSIVLYQSALDRLERTLQTLQQATTQAVSQGDLHQVRVYLVDHSPTPMAAAIDILAQRLVHPAFLLQYDAVGANPGFGAGHNRAFAAAGHYADYFLVANPDIECFPDSLQAGIACLAAHPERGLLAPALVDVDGTLRPACFRSPDLLTLLARWMGGRWADRRSHRYECRDWPAQETHLDPPLISGCCMLFRSAAYARLGGFDERYFLYFEDFELSRRARCLGLSIFWPAMRIRHHGGNTRRKSLIHHLHYLRSAVRYFTAHGGQP